MDIFKYDLYGGPNVGIYAQANNEYVLYLDLNNNAYLHPICQ